MNHSKIFIKYCLTACFLIALALPRQSFAQYGPYNVVKVTPIKLGIQRALAFSYERVFHKKQSAGLGFLGVFPWNALNTASLVGINSEGEKWELEQLRFTGFTLSPEYRYYIMEEAPRGLYAGGFLRYFQYKSQTSLNFDLDANTVGNLQADFRFRGIGLGAEIGYQKVWDSGFTIDYHVGAGVALAGLRLQGELNNVLPDQIGDAIEQVNDFLDQIPILNVALPGQDNFNVNTPVASGAWPVLRTSLSIGYAF